MLVNPSVYVPASAITVNVVRIVLVLCAVCALQNVAMCHLSQPCIMKVRRKMKTLTHMTYVGMSKTQSLQKAIKYYVFPYFLNLLYSTAYRYIHIHSA